MIKNGTYQNPYLPPIQNSSELIPLFTQVSPNEAGRDNPSLQSNIPEKIDNELKKVLFGQFKINIKSIENFSLVDTWLFVLNEFGAAVHQFLSKICIFFIP